MAISKIKLPDNSVQELRDSRMGNAKIFYGTCDTAAATVAKVVTCPDFTAEDLVRGALIFVTFDYTNSGEPASLTLNVNGTGAKGLKKKYTTSAAANLTDKGELNEDTTYLFQYNGTYWVCMTLDYNTNTTYSAMTAAQATQGTSTSGYRISPLVLAGAIDERIAALPEPMLFKGTVGSGGTITTLPEAATDNTGYTYKVITNGTYQSIAAKAGDTFISNGSSWTLIPSGDEPSGTVTNIATGTGLTGGPITTTGTISIDTDVVAMKSEIPSAVTESTVAGWGFTKNTGTYSKPSGGIPKSDLASAVQTSLEKADTALQSYTETDPVFSASAAAGISSDDISNWNNKVSNVQSDWNATTGAAVILNKPTIPAAVTESTVSGWGFTKNAGTVTSVKVGSTAYNPSDGVVSLPAYPTSLPASDVYDWAKASTRPSYSFSDISGTLSDSQIPSLSTSKITGLQATLDSKANSSDLASYLPLSGGLINNTTITMDNSGLPTYGGTRVPANKLAIGNNGIGIGGTDTSNDGAAIFIENDGTEKNKLIFALGDDSSQAGVDDWMEFRYYNTNSDHYSIRMPFANGTLALTSDLSGYLPLTGGTMSNTNLVTNLNADLLDGQHGSYYAAASSIPTAMTATEANTGTATTARTITAAVLAGAIDNKITCMTQNEVDATVNTIFS